MTNRGKEKMKKSVFIALLLGLIAAFLMGFITCAVVEALIAKIHH